MGSSGSDQTPKKTGITLGYLPCSTEPFRLRLTTAIISVYDKTGLLDLAKGLIKNNVRILSTGGTAKLIREGGFEVE